MNTLCRSRKALRSTACVASPSTSAVMQQLRCLSISNSININSTANYTASTIPTSQEQQIVTTNQKRTFAKKAKAKQAKVSPNKEPWGEVQTSTKGDRMMDVLIRFLDADYKQPGRKEVPLPSAEEMERRYHIGRNYNIGTSKEHNVVMHDLACKLKMKNHALKMLPRHSNGARPDLDKLREHAFSVSMDDEYMPREDRIIPGETPPIPEFDMDKIMGTEEN